MERGERRIALAVLLLVSIVGVIATATLLNSPTGQYMRQQGIYVVEDANAEFPFRCRNELHQPTFLGYDAQYRVYCCPEDYDAGANFCRVPHKTLITRMY